MIISSFKPNEEVLSIPINIFPKKWQFDAYENLLNYTEYDFPRYFFNSIFVTFFAVLLAVILCTTAGYGLQNINSGITLFFDYTINHHDTISGNCSTSFILLKIWVAKHIFRLNNP